MEKKYRPRYATAVFCDCENEKKIAEPQRGEGVSCVRRLGSLGGLGGRSVTLTVIVAVAAISALFLKLKARGPKKKQNSELGKDSGGMMMINNRVATF